MAHGYFFQRVINEGNVSISKTYAGSFTNQSLSSIKGNDSMVLRKELRIRLIGG